MLCAESWAQKFTHSGPIHLLYIDQHCVRAILEQRGGELRPMGQIQFIAYFCMAFKLRISFLNGWGKTE